MKDNYHYFQNLGKKNILIIGFITFVLVLTSIVYFISSTQKNHINIFENKKIVFAEAAYNRYVVYKNKYNVDDEYFLKQEVFYLSGNAEIGINTDYLTYNKRDKVLTIRYPKYKLFNVVLNSNSAINIDSIKPKAISELQASKMGAVVGLSGVVSGALAGKKLAVLLPKPYSLVATSVGAVFGGMIGYGVTSSAFRGLQLSKDISQQEKQIVIESANNLILATFNANAKLQEMYKVRFENYMRMKYASVNYKIQKFHYEEQK